MLARPHLLLAALVGGLASGSYLTVGVVWALVLLVPAVAIAMLRVRPAVGLLAAVLMVLGAAAGQERARAYDRVPRAVATSGEFAGTAHLVERFRPSGHSLRGRVVVDDGPARGALIEVRLGDGMGTEWGSGAARGTEPSKGTGFALGAEVAIGSRLALAGRIKPVSAYATAGGDVGYRRWLRSEGVDAVLTASGLQATGERRGGVAGAFDSLRIRAERALAAGLPEQPAALMRGMVLGGDEQFAPSLRDDFRAVGLSHIVAVSGANVMLLVVLVAAVCGAVGIGFRGRFWLALACVCVYVPLCGAGASVVRAGVMGVAALCATRLARAVSRSYLLLLAALALLLLNPRAPEDVGAQLSFAAVLGLMAFAGPLQHWFAARARLPTWLAEAAAATTAATLATAPVSAFHFGAVSVVALVANVLAAPVIGPVVWIGSIAALAGQAAVWPAELLNAPAGFMLAYLIELAHTLAALPAAQVDVQLGWWGLAVGAAALVLLVLAIHRPPAFTRMWRHLHRPRQNHRRAPQYRAVAAIVAILLLAGSAWTAMPGGGSAARRPAIVFLDVGQGDAQLLLGTHGCEALIDGGPFGSGVDRQLKRFGVDRLELVLATHPAADHHGGLLDAMRAGNLRVDRFLAGGQPSADPSYAQLAQMMRDQGAEVGEAAAGVRWSCGNLSLAVIGPAPAKPGQRPPDDPNTRAAVTQANVGVTTLLTSGDAESPQLLMLPLRPADVFKVPHHGSADPGLPRVLAQVRPSVAVIQSGAHNPYGHPRGDVLRALASTAIVKRTDRDGTVVVEARAAAPTADAVAPKR